MLSAHDIQICTYHYHSNAKSNVVIADFLVFCFSRKFFFLLFLVGSTVFFTLPGFCGENESTFGRRVHESDL